MCYICNETICSKKLKFMCSFANENEKNIKDKKHVTLEGGKVVKLKKFLKLIENSKKGLCVKPKLEQKNSA